MKLDELLNEVKIDNQNGIGVVPYNMGGNPDYFGMRVIMKPSIFLKLAAKVDHPNGERYIELRNKITSGEGVGSPFLNIKVPSEWRSGNLSSPAEICGHEGRHRMYAILDTEGDAPMEVHMWGKFNDGELRARHLTDEMKNELNNGMISENGQYIVGPLFKLK